MALSKLASLMPAVLDVGTLVATGAQAATQSVAFGNLVASATVQTPLAVGDTLLVNTSVTTEVGALLQSVSFTVAAGVTGLTGGATWQISTAAGPGPRLVGVDISIFGPGNTLVTSDTFVGTLGGFAVSSFNSPILPGLYTLIATGTGVRESVLDVSVSMVPEPEGVLLMLAGLAAVGLVASKRKAVLRG